MLRKRQVAEWLESPVTEALKQAVAERVNDCAEEILRSTDPDYDRTIKGMVHAFREVLEWEPETVEENDEDEVSSRDAG